MILDSTGQTDYEKLAKRRWPEEEIEALVSNPFLNDWLKLIQSKAYRRLAYKTQVMSSPDNPHIRTRLMHTNEVMALSRIIAEKLNLNQYLCDSIAAGHDIGHTPYGHIGERTISKFFGKKFEHAVNSVIIAQHIERKGKGLNLTLGTLEGMLYHSRGSGELILRQDTPPEYSAVMFADKIAYAFSDLNDAIRCGYLTEDMIPKSVLGLGKCQRERVKTVIDELVSQSQNKGYVDFSEGLIFERFNELKDFMYEKVYYAKNESMQKQILLNLCEFFKKNEEELGVNAAIMVSLLTDPEADYFGELLKSREIGLNDIKTFGIFEIIPYIKNKNFDYTNPDLDWGK